MYRVNDKEVNKHWIYLDDDSTPLLLPCLYARYINQLGLSIELVSEKNRITNKTTHYFNEQEIGDNAQYVRGNQLGLFLRWVKEQESPDSLISLYYHTALPVDIINEYINDYLIDGCSKSEIVVDRAVLSLQSYYNWLHYFFENKYKNIGVYASHRALARANNKQKLIVDYLLPATRELIYRNTKTLLEEIILRNGGELGCRAKENQGFLLKDFRVNNKSHSGMLNLFYELEENPNKDEFKYHLSSLYTKYGRSRTLYISRALLEKMKLYYDTERPITDCDHLFVSNSSNHTRGECISTQYASDTFHSTVQQIMSEVRDYPKLYEYCQILEEDHVYHTLRHSFGTDIFYDQCVAQNKHPDSITTESAVYIETARRMGHKVDGRYSNQTTKRYIHSCGYRVRLLKEVVNGG
ncbi:site-specific integrase [Vibrio crassostreae]|uniref:site-specific integrase n=1 Tax=Vibrio crassostreae TaxID=246167 RepID=UPI000F51056E|nr:site-specific integrase [Vibrio crassostreae]RPF13323.1 hypothetical protein EDB12_4221 [Vibrio crassostreae]